MMKSNNEDSDEDRNMFTPSLTSSPVREQDTALIGVQIESAALSSSFPSGSFGARSTGSGSSNPFDFSPSDVG